MTSNEKVDIGNRLLLRAALFVGGAYLLYLLQDVVIVVLFAVLTAAVLVPAINKLQEWGLSRTVSVILAYTVLFFGGVALVGVCIPVLFTEIKEFLNHWPKYTEQLEVLLSGLDTYAQTIGFSFDKQTLFHNFEGSLSEWLGSFFSTTLDFFQGFIHVIGFFFLALYLSLEEKGIEKFFLMLTPEEYHAHARSLALRMQGKVSQWLFGQVLLMIIAFIIYYIGLLIIGVPYALAIAFFGGLMEIIPYIGPVLAAVPAILIGLLYSPGLGLAALIFYLIAHQVEAHVIAPQVMKRSANLNPVALIIAILIGIELGGLFGVILAVPITMVLSVFVEDIFEKRRG
ncbi:MAG: AI-2E family transporter [Candidatus Moranbacteria bacterium]|jgi:predicted PurR-regulated permease PerM|nr:AI-2E family transporter [Candidatus Moranbacteria bacterium]MBP9801097.1 AI-2E family transporter [Candidatus Moranbacteria bacterium]